MKTLLILASVAALAAPALASAKPAATSADDLRQVVVSFADLNLNTPTGQSSLKARIHRAAMDACGIQPDNKDIRATRAFTACVEQSIGAATAAVPAASLLAGDQRSQWLIAGRRGMGRLPSGPARAASNLRRPIKAPDFF